MIGTKLTNGFINLIHFSRLHTIIGTFTATSAIFVVVISGVENLTYSNFVYYSIFLTGALSINIFIVGINQIYDVEIDRINKPNLPLAKGDITMKAGWTITILALILGFIVSISNIILLVTALVITIIGIIYSVPPFRLRNNFLLASLLIILGRTFLLNLSAYFYFNTQINSSNKVNSEIVYILTFILIISTVISLFKDIPDITGDAIFQIRTLVTIIDKSLVYNFCIALLLVNYLIVIYLQFFILDLFYENFLLIYHIIVIISLIFSFILRHRIINNLGAIKLYYKYIWVLLYLEYLAIAFLTK